MPVFKHSETLEVVEYDDTKVRPVNTGTYRHFKGVTYEVEGQIWLGQCFVLYRKDAETLWGRPYHLFFEVVSSDGEEAKRFQKL